MSNVREDVANYLVSMDHADDFIIGYGATMDELDDFARNEALARADDILDLILGPGRDRIGT